MTDRTELAQIWALYCSGRQLSDAEYARLERELNDDISGPDLAADQRLHRMLKALGTIDETKDDFVAGVVAGCAGVDVAVPEPQEPPTALTTLPAPSSAAHITARPSARRSGRNQMLLRHPVVLLPVLCSLVLTAALLLMFDRYRAVQRQVTAIEKKMRTQRTDFEAQIDAERNRKPRPPLPTPVAVPEKSRNTLSATSRNQADPSAIHEVSSPVARLMRSENAVWKTAPATASLSAGRWDLESGTAQLVMPGGSEVELQAPSAIELVNSSHVVLDRGQLTATVAADDIGFRVSTPNTRIVDLGTRFRVAVDERGETSIDVDQGEVVVIPWDVQNGGRRWHLAAGKFDRAVVFPAAGADRHMLASRVSGPDGFQGQIQLAGETMDLASRDHFDRLKDGVAEQMAVSPAEAVSNWLKLTKTVNSASGSITVNGKEVPISGLDGVLDFENQLLNDDSVPSAGNSQQNSVFSGQVDINGQKRSFSSREEYEAFRKEMFQSLKGFGIPGPAQMQLEADKKKNPFQP